MLRLGSVCTGYGGLDLAVASVLDVEHAWVSDVCKFGPDGAGHHDPCRAPCTILAHRFPGVPNLGDLTRIDWHAVAPVDVLTAGYPCQPFSHAGRRRGTDDPRHLWPFIREAIRVLRPRLTFLENVDGHRSLGFDRVVGDMAEDGMHVRWVVLPASGVGAPHQRKRLFIAITPDADDLGHERGGQHGTGARDLRTVVQDAEREGWGAEGHAAAGEASGGRSSAIAGRSGGAPVTLLPTPDSSAEKYRLVGDSQQSRSLPALAIRGELDGALLPTPAVNDMGAAYTPETWDEWTARMKAEHNNGNGHGPSLNIEAQRIDMLPTPSVADGEGGHETRSGARSGERLLPGVAKYDLLPTTTTMDAHSSGGNPDTTGTHGTTPTDATVRQPSRWGKYAAAIAHWEAITRPAPEPTTITAGYLKTRAKRLARQDKRPVGMRGSLKVRRQLAATFSEWMMGVPLGWITAVPGITRNEALKAAGNGVVPQQAAEALRYLLAMPTGAQIAAAHQPDDLLELLAVGE
ncbi:DNA cytosine methyltransferase [Nocardioides sp. YIM 152315]|uniref:DNA cytosine methyltransferase n=1 Tax=Nocardioides sp. YIM 152315 TaxID=3031760 RepID=UPI0023DCB52B|nr:DNA cytosine methyltransferase [Nocardioides sp. YIM 152315]MDF1603371.1 DNA cytosine methyltransferase [Nocardioides sp. YIM 152315]